MSTATSCWSRVDPEYDRDQDRRNERYTVEAVKLALSDAAAPDAYAFDGFSAFDVWAGYLVLDAWVAGRDRHHENWAVVAGPLQRRVLAPSFDLAMPLASKRRQNDTRAWLQMRR